MGTDAFVEGSVDIYGERWLRMAVWTETEAGRRGSLGQAARMASYLAWEGSMGVSKDWIGLIEEYWVEIRGLVTYCKLG